MTIREITSSADLAERFAAYVTEDLGGLNFDLTSIMADVVLLAKLHGMTRVAFLLGTREIWDGLEVEIMKEGKH